MSKMPFLRFTRFFFLLILVHVAAVPIVSAQLPDTGQTTCYDASGNTLSPCPAPGEAFYGQDATYSIKSPSFTKLDASGTELSDSATDWVMVKDNVTGLIWEVKTDDGTVHDKSFLYTFDNAQNSFISELNTNSFGGFSDWRMPTREELRSIVDYEQLNPAVPPVPGENESYFKLTQQLPYWTSTPNAAVSGQAWYIFFQDGSDDVDDQVNAYYVRAVRGSSPAQSFTDNGDGTITDNNTGLMWQKEGPADRKTWQDALSYAESLSLAGNDDWRLPNLKELASIADLTTSTPAIDTTFFPFPAGSATTFYWSSTSQTFNPANAWRILFNSGADVERGKTSTYLVRAVRGGLCEQAFVADLNSDCNTDLADSIIALKVAAGIDGPGLMTNHPLADITVNSSGLVGLKEAIYALQDTAGLR